MTTTFLTLLLLLTIAVLVSTAAALIAYALARWEGANRPSSLSRAGMAFAGSLTLCYGLIALTRG
ncbi:hypothetical protein [Streptomyces sp. NPDC052036]|uniref:hypothetical protein n=1 Tax=Streptomyces sp. NPDC052036 TaxID=3155171 RepID=UPI00341412DA